VPHWKELNYWARIDGIFGDDVLLRLAAEKRAKWSMRYRLKLKMGLTPAWHRERDVAYRLAKAAARGLGAPHKAYANALFALSSAQTRAVGEICPQYALLSEKTLSQMAALGTNARFLFLMRDPVARLISGVRHGIRMSAGENAVTVQSLVDGVAEVLDEPSNWAMKMTAYHETIVRLEQIVPEQNILYCFYETMFDQQQMDRICDFLGVSHHAADLDDRVHAGARPDVVVPPKKQEEIARSLSHVYQAMRAQFKSDIPAAWHKPSQAVTYG